MSTQLQDHQLSSTDSAQQQQQQLPSRSTSDVSVASSPSPHSNSIQPPTFKATPLYTIDLNTPPRQRWQPIVREYLNEMKPLKNYIDQMAHEQAGWFGKLGMKISGWASQQLLTTVSDSIVEELKGIAELTQPAFGLSYSDLLNLNLGYNFLAMCSSIAVKEFNRGESKSTLGSGEPKSTTSRALDGVYHLRNLDWDVAIAEPFRNLTIDVEFVRGSQLIYRATTWVGFNGFLTGMRYRQFSTTSSDNTNTTTSNGTTTCTATPFSISLNYRKNKDSNEIVGFVKNVLAGFMNYYPAEYLIRKLLEDADSLETALRWIDHYPMMAPCYLVLCGEENAYLLSKTRTSDLNRLQLKHEMHKMMEKVVQQQQQQTGAEQSQPSSSKSVASNVHQTQQAPPQRAFLVQTNIDHWETSVDKEWAGDDALLHNSLDRKCAAQAYLSQSIEDYSKLKLVENTSKEQLSSQIHNSKIMSQSAHFRNIPHDTSYFNFLMQCISNYPSCNQETVYQVICNPKNNFYFSRIIYNPPTDPSNNYLY
ncbi:hypothetical protein C9374_010060 [Naegleria lovaniensis]|uniref:ceramidase n=1 Tax=Naegleria lovaniensis TaxID=51637 RepID=A0AA88GEH1_NAELO|nr:uncharacterized protein C9374_010060 [Naegleria lovaniensis]KAG2375056.1 hypothetical protein C9374_010060 [Naegleria lovaniensis]